MTSSNSARAFSLPPIPEYSTYLFDVGGTLIELDKVARAQAYVKRANQVGVEVRQDEAYRVLLALEHQLPDLTRNVPLSLMSVADQRAFWLDWWAEGFRQMGVAEADAWRFADELLDPLHGDMFQKVSGDTVPALNDLRARGKRMGIISNFSPNCESLLTRLGIAHFFDFFVVSGIFGVEKPDPRIFQEAVRLAGKEIAELVYVGDSPFHDVEGAKTIGMDGILLDRPNRFPDFMGRRIRDLREL